MAKSKQINLGMNYFMVAATVTKKDCQYSTNGTLVSKLRVKVPGLNPQYSTVLDLVAFNSKKEGGPKTAEMVEETVQENKNYVFSGYISSNSYKDKSGVERYGYNFNITKFNALEDVVEKQEMDQTMPETTNDDIPF